MTPFPVIIHVPDLKKETQVGQYSDYLYSMKQHALTDISLVLKTSTELVTRMQR
jgi:hypothetical protein